MEFNPEFAKKWFGSTEHDAIRSLRPGGPFDQVRYNLTCTTCGKKTDEFLRWFYNNDFLCACGGLYDAKPIADAIKKTLADYLIRTKSPEEIMEILERGGDDTQ